MRGFLQKNAKFYPKIFRYKKIVLIIVGAVFILVLFNLLKGKTTETETQAKSSNQKIQAPVIKARQDINQTFSFSIGNSKITYTVENAELQDEIIVKGQIAKAVKGKTFLVLNLKIRNDSNVVVEVNSRNYIRLTINDNKNDKLALEIHNDPVLVQPISTKLTRLGFPIKDEDKNLSLYVGEIEGRKKEIVVNFNN